MTDPATAALLRLEVGRLRAREARRRFDTVVHVGRLGAGDRACPVPTSDPVLDPGTRTDLTSRLLEAYVDQRDEPGAVGTGRVATPPGASACLWVVRPGEPLLQDGDLAWLSAAARAFDVWGYRLDGCWVVTRTGWLDVRTGECRTWKRLRL